jgi:tRNA threonylcarbamoyladenosine biosynthesis protein TsaB
MLLAIDTSTRSLGLALYDGARVLSETVWTSAEHHTVELAPAVQLILKNAGSSLEDLQALAVALGPGSFTALRIGLALAKGLALARNLSLIGIPTLDFLAAAQPVREMPLIAVLQAGRGRLGVCNYKTARGGWQAAGETRVTNAEALYESIESPTWVCGELSEDERRLLARKRKIILLASPAQSLRRPSYLAEMAWKRMMSGKVDNPAALAPIYLHTGEPIPE